MNKVNYNDILANKVVEFESGEVNFTMLAKYKQLINDRTYFNFVIESQNCGFYFEKSLQFYSYSSIHKFNDIEYINSLLQSEYGDIVTEVISFGQDLFGNQFCFDLAKKYILFFNSETGEKEIVATSFTNWINELYKRFDYFTGINILKSWLLNKQFDFNNRLCPKMPFIIGGEFKVDNLYTGTFPDFIKAYANIARQIYKLPDGTKIKLQVDKNLDN